MTTYVEPNFQSKAALKMAVALKQSIMVFCPGLGGPVPVNGTVYISGPHYPKPHKWYAEGRMENGKLVSIK